MIPRPMANAIIVLVSIVWAANFFLQFIVPSYEPDITLNGVFMAVVGVALGLQSRKGGDKDNDSDGKP